jgi:salicylate hydroxylase
VVVLEQAERLEETGAGIQLSPNAARILIDLGLDDLLRPQAIAPAALRVLNAASGREIVRMALDTAQQRYGAPYWVIHRGDLQAALVAAASRHLDITINLGTRVEDFVTHPNGVTVSAHRGAQAIELRGLALLAADGLWSNLRTRLGYRQHPRYVGRTAWRALVPASAVAPEFRQPLVHLWLGRNAHMVHYPVKAGRLINVVVITANTWHAAGWSEPASRTDLMPYITVQPWAPAASALLGLPDAWLKWALYDRRALWRWSQGAVALIGDAAHPMLPYLAQGAGMAIEDAAVAAQCLARMPEDAAAALRTYCAMRRLRTWKVQRLAARNGARYHWGGVLAFLRDAAMRMAGDAALLRHYDWLYDWRPPPALSLD